MTMVPCFLDETIEKSKDYSPQSFGEHKHLVQTQMNPKKFSQYLL
jgi:hypothetical protein